MIIIDNPGGLAPASTPTSTYTHSLLASPHGVPPARQRETNTHVVPPTDYDARTTKRPPPPPLRITNTDLFLRRSTATRSGRYRAAGLCLSPLYKLVSNPRAWLLAAAAAAAAVVAFAAHTCVCVYGIFRVFFRPWFFSSALVRLN